MYLSSAIRPFIRCLNTTSSLSSTSINLPNYFREENIKNNKDEIEYEKKLAKKLVVGIQNEEQLYYESIKNVEKKDKYGFKFKI